MPKNITLYNHGCLCIDLATYHWHMVSRNHENFPNVTTVSFGSCLLNTLLRAAPAVLGFVVAEGAFRRYANARILLITSIVATLIFSCWIPFSCLLRDWESWELLQLHHFLNLMPRPSMPFFSQKENFAVTTKESCTWF
mmetsp:Transcript_10667/g.19321  ORF Transcript_10667/g.19321 Transcript_10667/m.19321 type:complete len:139 (+) Transcript_10667:264-680(+)